MKKYKFSFVGRQHGAIGIFYNIVDTYTAKDMNEAKSLLYTDYEHIQMKTINGKTDLIEEYHKAQFVEVPPTKERRKYKSDRATYVQQT